ncbi:hypothetical protein Bca4012_037632 [Brassica carinata]
MGSNRHAIGAKPGRGRGLAPGRPARRVPRRQAVPPAPGRPAWSAAGARPGAAGARPARVTGAALPQMEAATGPQVGIVVAAREFRRLLPQENGGCYGTASWYRRCGQGISQAVAAGKWRLLRDRKLVSSLRPENFAGSRRRKRRPLPRNRVVATPGSRLEMAAAASETDWISEPVPHINPDRKKRLSIFSPAEQKIVNQARTMRAFPDLSILLAGKLNPKDCTSEGKRGSPSKGGPSRQVGSSGPQVVAPEQTNKDRDGSSPRGDADGSKKRNNKKKKELRVPPREDSEEESVEALVWRKRKQSEVDTGGKGVPTVVLTDSSAKVSKNAGSSSSAPGNPEKEDEASVPNVDPPPLTFGRVSGPENGSGSKDPPAE